MTSSATSKDSGEVKARTPRILYVVNAFETDAPTRVTATIAAGLRSAGWDVAMVAWSRDGELHATLKDASIPTAVLSGLRSISLARFIRNFQPDVVHSILARPTLGTLVSRAILPGRRFYWVVGDHGVHEWHERGRTAGCLMERIMPAVLSVADAVTTVSGAAADQLLRRGVSTDRVRVIPNGVDAQKFFPGSRAERCAFVAANFPNDDVWEVWPLIGSAGNLRVIKGFESLLVIMPGILHKWPKARLVIWGDGPDRERLQRMAADFQIEHAVRFAGRTDRIEKLLPLLDLYVQPSFEESFGLAAAEAMCCGVPVIVSDAGGLPELAAYGRAAMVYPVHQRVELARTMLELFDDKRRLKRMGSTGRGWILHNYTVPRMVRRMASLYRDLLSYPDPSADLP